MPTKEYIDGSGEVLARLCAVVNKLRPHQRHADIRRPDCHHRVPEGRGYLSVAPPHPSLPKQAGVDPAGNVYADTVDRRPEAANHMGKACNLEPAHHMDHLVSAKSGASMNFGTVALMCNRTCSSKIEGNSRKKRILAGFFFNGRPKTPSRRNSSPKFQSKCYEHGEGNSPRNRVSGAAM